MRRCRDERMDFTEKDDPSVFPIYVTKGSSMFSFCPGKATWDKDVVSVYRALKISAESGTMWGEGGISDQPEWWIELLAWFLPRYSDLRFYGRVKSVLGDDPGQALTGRQPAKGRGQIRGRNQR
jgi:hypothetical protein